MFESTSKLCIVLERKKVLSRGGTPIVAAYVELGDVRLYIGGEVILGEHSFGPKVAIDNFEFGAGFIAYRERGSRTLFITPPDGEPLEFIHRGVFRGWAKLLPFYDDGLAALEARFGERLGHIAYNFVRLFRQIT